MSANIVFEKRPSFNRSSTQSTSSEETDEKPIKRKNSHLDPPRHVSITVSDDHEHAHDSNQYSSPPRQYSQESSDSPINPQNFYERNDNFSKVSHILYERSKAKYAKYLEIDRNIDKLRPYFDLEPRQLVSRLLKSFSPRGAHHIVLNLFQDHLATTEPPKVETLPPELYGPLMIVLTLVALLLAQMKFSGTIVTEGTLMGTALVTCFGYWGIATSFIYFLAVAAQSLISFIQLSSLVGYSLFSHLLVLLMGNLEHLAWNHDLLFWLFWLSLGGLSALRIGNVLLSRSVRTRQNFQFRLCLVIAPFVLNLTFLIYLHFRYHKMVDAVIHV